MSARSSEADLAAVVVSWLSAAGFDLYQEVELRTGGIRADIVARRGPELTIVETKATASLALLYQAMERRRCAHRIYVAVPSYRARRNFADLCDELGIGLFAVKLGSNDTWDADRVEEVVTSRRWASKPLRLANRLRPEHKTSAAAGSPTGGHWSRWRETCAQLARVVAAEPGITLNDALKMTRHHYSSGRSALSAMASHIREGRVAGVRFESGGLITTEGGL